MKIKKTLKLKTVSKLDKAIVFSADHNCLTCRKFVSCAKPKKSFNYVCDSFKSHKTKLALDDLLYEAPTAKSKSKIAGKRAKEESDIGIDFIPDSNKKSKTRKYSIDNTDDDENGFNIEKLVQEIEADQETGILKDLKIDDGDIPEAPNSFKFITDPYYLNYKPYPKQLEIALNYYNDYCANPKCTNIHYVKNIPTDAYKPKAKDPEVIYGEILDNITLLKNGKCPRCGNTRAYGWERGTYYPYTEMAGLAGQRCVVFDTYVLTANGMLQIGELFEGRDYGFSSTEIEVNNGAHKIATATKLYKAKAENPVKVSFSDGTRLTGTRDHPILTSKGMIKNKDLSVGRYIPIFLGQDQWGTGSLYQEEIVQALSEPHMPRSIREADKLTNIAYLNLLFSLYGRIDLDEDHHVLQLCLLNNRHAEEIKFVLQNLGIASYLKQRNTGFDVEIAGEAIIRAIVCLDLRNDHITEDFVSQVVDYHGYGNAPFYWTTYDTYHIGQLDSEPSYYIKVTSIELLQTRAITYDFHIPEGSKFFANGLVSSNSGKSALLACMASNTTHRFMKMQNAPQVMGLAKNTILHGVFIATTFSQAKDSLFDPIHDLIYDSPFFQEYHSLLDHYGRKHGEELYKFKDTIISYKPRRLAIYPSVPNKRSLRGRSLFEGGVDEIGHFDSNKGTAVKLNADEIHIAMKRSFLSVTSATRNLRKQGKYNIPEALLGNISSPVSRFDKICRLVEDAKNSKTVYSYHYSVYEMNPTITPEDLEDERRNNPEAYKRDYLAIPPRASSAFIHNTKIVRACIDKQYTNAFHIKQKPALSASGSEITKAWVKFVRRDSVTPRVLGLDAGEVNNAFSLCLMSINSDGFPVVDGIGEITPEPNQPLNFNNVYEKVIKPICEAFNVRFVCADRWNSATILSDLEAELGIGQAYHKLTYDDFTAVKAAMTDAQVILPKNEIFIKDAMNLAGKNYPFCFIGKPVSHFIVQLLTVEEVLGKTVVKGEKKTDDMFRAYALAYTKIMDAEIRDIYLNAEGPAQLSTAIGAMASLGSPIGATSGTELGSIASMSSGGKGGGVQIFVGRQ